VLMSRARTREVATSRALTRSADGFRDDAVSPAPLPEPSCLWCRAAEHRRHPGRSPHRRLVTFGIWFTEIFFFYGRLRTRVRLGETPAIDHRHRHASAPAAFGPAAGRGGGNRLAGARTYWKFSPATASRYSAHRRDRGVFVAAVCSARHRLPLPPPSSSPSLPTASTSHIERAEERPVPE